MAIEENDDLKELSVHTTDQILYFLYIRILFLFPNISVWAFVIEHYSLGCIVLFLPRTISIIFTHLEQLAGCCTSSIVPSLKSSQKSFNCELITHRTVKKGYYRTHLVEYVDADNMRTWWQCFKECWEKVGRRPPTFSQPSSSSRLTASAPRLAWKLLSLSY